MVGYIDIRRIELHKGTYAIQKLRPADRPLGRYYFERSKLFLSVEDIANFHTGLSNLFEGLVEVGDYVVDVLNPY